MEKTNELKTELIAKSSPKTAKNIAVYSAKELAVMSVTVALLIGGQFMLSAIAGVEIVTALFISFCFAFGLKRGVVVATAFSLLRCFVFGFFPTVIILYLVYFNLVAVIFGLLGKLDTKIWLVVLSACLCTVCFTLLDDIITPIFYGYTLKMSKAYFVASLPAMFTQTVCTLITVTILFLPLKKIFKSVENKL